MTADQLEKPLKSFIDSIFARQICRRYRAEPEDAFGEIFLQLARRLGTEAIRDPEAWVNSNATGYLRNYLKKEYGGSRRRRLKPLQHEVAAEHCPASVRHDRRRNGKKFSREHFGEPVRSLLERERQTLVEGATHTIPASEFEALASDAKLGAVSCRALARRDGVHWQTVCNRAKRAKQKLRIPLGGLR